MSIAVESSGDDTRRVVTTMSPGRCPLDVCEERAEDLLELAAVDVHQLQPRGPLKGRPVGGVRSSAAARSAQSRSSRASGNRAPPFP